MASVVGSKIWPHRRQVTSIAIVKMLTMRAPQKRASGQRFHRILSTVQVRANEAAHSRHGTIRGVLADRPVHP